MKRLLAIIAISALSGIVEHTAHAQNLLLNGSFESPAIPANTISADHPSFWEVCCNPSFRLLNGSYGAPEYPGPQNGLQYAAIEGLGVLSQTFTITTAGSYVLNWFDNSSDQPNSSPYTVTVSSNSGTVVIASLDASHFPNWLSHSIQLNLNPGLYTNVFRTTGPVFGPSTLIDNVSVKPAGIIQACPCEGPVTGGTWKNHGQYVSCIAKAAEAVLSSGLITEDMKDAIVEEAAESSCGKK